MVLAEFAFTERAIVEHLTLLEEVEQNIGSERPEFHPLHSTKEIKGFREEVLQESAA